MKKAYEAPEIRDLGSLTELTQQSFNKVGPAADVITAINQNIIGSLVGFP